jgi:UDP-N-acetylmuramoylalanine--D-glutamate ligase
MIQRCAGRIKVAILIGADRELIEVAFREFSPQTQRIMVDPDSDYLKGGVSNSLMENIVRTAQTYAAQGDTVLMAPACASMDQFVSYADRGNRFAEAVKKLVANEN